MPDDPAPTEAARLEDVRAALGSGFDVARDSGSLAAGLRPAVTRHEIELRCGDRRGEISRRVAAIAGFPVDEDMPDLRRARALVAGHPA